MKTSPSTQEGTRDPDPLSPRLRPVLAKIKRLLDKAAIDDLVALHDLGELVRHVRFDVEQYGNKALEELAEHLGLRAELLYQYRDLADRFSRDELESLARRRMENGHRLTTGHLMAFRVIRVAPERAALIERTLSESWDTFRLSKAIMAALNPTSPVPRPVRPPTMSKSLTQLTVAADKLARHLPAWEQAIARGIDDAVPGSITSDTAAAMTEAETKVRELLAALEQCAGTLARCRPRTRQVVDARGPIREGGLHNPTSHMRVDDT